MLEMFPESKDLCFTFLFLFLGHIHRCSGVTSRYALRNHS